MGKLINIDNGGTLTDIVVVDGESLHRVKTLTTPFDLSQCFFDGLRRASRELYGDEDVQRLLATTDFIRYSTTVGTNALIQRRGPEIGLILAKGADPAELRYDEHSTALFGTLVSDRIAYIDASLTGTDLEQAVLNAVQQLASAGAIRLVVSMNGADYKQTEKAIKHFILDRYPSHLLGTLPVLYSSEVAHDLDDVRRTWTSLLNAFLHPAMEEFLYHAQHRLSEQGVGTPLLIFRNDGGIARVAKTKAITSLSSGPRGGLGGVEALATHYDLDDVVSVDVGGTSSDVGRVRRRTLHTAAHGLVEGIPISYPLADLANLGVGGGSIVRVQDGKITVGPDSVGAAPGPACFGLGGTHATITDAMLVKGVLDPATYLSGELALDRDRAAKAVMDNVGDPLGLTLDEAVDALIARWTETVAEGVKESGFLEPGAVLASFGGAGPMSACNIADALGVDRVLIPGTAAVFSAVGIGFSDLSQQYRAPLVANDAPTIVAERDALIDEARRDMFAEGVDLAECTVDSWLLAILANGETASVPLDENGSLIGTLPHADEVFVVVRAAKPIPKVHMVPQGNMGPAATDPVIAGKRTIRNADGTTQDVVVLRLEEQQAGATAEGPVVLEEPYFTAFVPEGWGIRLTANKDIWLQRG